MSSEKVSPELAARGLRSLGHHEAAQDLVNLFTDAPEPAEPPPHAPGTAMGPEDVDGEQAAKTRAAQWLDEVFNNTV